MLENAIWLLGCIRIWVANNTNLKEQKEETSMVILGVFVVLAIILTWFVVKATREERSEVNRAIEICIPI